MSVCPDCDCEHPLPTAAELLLSAADILTRRDRPSGVGTPLQVLVADAIHNDMVERMVLALRLQRAPAVVRLRAVAEAWDLSRIVQEIY